MEAKKFKDFKKIKDKVRWLLETHPELRDSDDRLISTYYLNEIGVDESKQMSGYNVLNKIYYSQLTNFESIRRIRMAIQAEREDLRNENYKTRNKRKLPNFIVRNRD